VPRGILAVVLTIGLCGCGGGGSDPPTPPLPAAPVAGEIGLLFMGNSHTSLNALPDMVGAMVRAARPGRVVTVAEAPGWMFLDERSADPPSLALLRSRPWTFVVLQAQKYSESGLFDYPITGALTLIRAARGQNATPIMFPEWPRLGIPESQRIFALHVSIAQSDPACVPPIPQAFDLALSLYPSVRLHAADGNHSTPMGAFLAALVIATTMTGTPPTQLPFLPDFPAVEAGTQAALRAVAEQTLAQWPARQYCPLDPALP
jgi:hypothetical protein